MTTVLGILAGVVLLGLIMVLHELGHFLAGRALGFKIEQFSIFMGPVLFERVKNGIRYNIKAIPLGASVSFAGEDSLVEGEKTDQTVSPDDPGLFMNKPRWQRAIVIAMGPLTNFLTAFIVFCLLFTIRGTVVPVTGKPVAGSLIESSEIEPGDRIVSVNGTPVRTAVDLGIAELVHEDGEAWVIGYRKPSGEEKTAVLQPAFGDPRPMLGITFSEKNGVYTVVRVDPAADRGAASFMPGDQVVALEGIPFSDGARIQKLLSDSAGKTFTAEIIRSGERIRLSVSPVLLSLKKPLGLTLTFSKKPADTLSQGFHYPMAILRSTFRGLGMLFSGKMAVKDSFAGPVGIVSVVADTVARGKTAGEVVGDLMSMLGILSVAVGFTNLIPIPPLDGNHLILLAVEGIRRKPLSKKFRSVAGIAGFIIFAVLGLFVLWLDLSRLFGW